MKVLAGLLLVVLTTNLLLLAECEKILLVFPAVSKSHFKVGEALMLGLADAGHKVTMLCAYDYKTSNPNVDVVQLTGALEIAEERTKEFNSLDQFNMPVAVMLPVLFWFGYEFSDMTMSHPNVQEMMRTRSFDLVIVEMFCNEAMIGFGQHFNAPVISVSTFGASKWTNDLVGTPSPLSYVPHSMSQYTGKMSYWQRAGNTLLSMFETLAINIMEYPAQRKVYNKAFPNARCTYDEAMRNVSLVLLNSHVSMSSPRPYVPNMIEVGGMHVNRHQNIDQLPKDIREFLDSAGSAGVVYFSLGSTLKSTFMSAETQQIFARVFGSLKQRVIWKLEEQIPMPANVLISDWLPQSEILAHPNVKVFITHGGLLGTTEAIYHGVPIVGMPFFGDQKRNIQTAVQAGWGVQLDYKNVTEQSLRWALLEVIEHSSYMTAAKEVSKRYRDQPMTPLETAIYWTEYVIRHRGAPHLRSASMDLGFVQYHNLDVFLMLTLSSLVALVISWKVTKCCWRKIRKGKKIDADKKKQ